MGAGTTSTIGDDRQGGTKSNLKFTLNTESCQRGKKGHEEIHHGKVGGGKEL